jgi:hypothetical protein
MAASTLTTRQMNRATLARQMLLAREPIPPLKAIERLVAMQAQWPRPPFVGLWTRIDNFQRGALTALFTKRQVVRATHFRATIHVMTTKDYVGFRSTIQPSLENAIRAVLRDRVAGLDLETLLARARTLLADQPRTFEDLRQRFLDADPNADERAMGYAVRLMLPLVQMPVGDAAWAFPSQACFALADQWLKREIPLRAPSRVNDLVLRYLATYGPATVAEVQGWSGVPHLKDALESLRPRLVTFRDERRRELFDLPDAPRPDPDVPAPVRFLPEYDHAIGARADERLVAKDHRPRVFLSALRIAATVLIDGFVAATWKLARTKSTATISIEPFAPFAPRTRKQVEAEGDALIRFVEPEARAFEVRFVK